MTRPKVPPEQRQRTAQACESCKRRKQKCNGEQPCNTCDRRKFTCIYIDRDDATSPENAPPAKKVNTNQSTASSSPTRSLVSPYGQSPSHSSVAATARRKESGSQITSNSSNVSRTQFPMASPASTFDKPVKENGTKFDSNHVNALTHEILNGRNASRATTTSAPDEEAVVYTQMRMLQDPTGRLLYVGDSATLSFLQLIRMMVENVMGPSPFTTDPRRHRIQESQLSVSPHDQRSHLLPDFKTASVLVEAFFTNTQGMIQIFDRRAFRSAVEACYSDPLAAQPSWLCLLNLVFAIGLTLATPRPNSPESVIIQKLRGEPQDRGELFFLNAKNFSDPMSGLEDADFWSVQALLLIAFYMLAKAKRNACFAYLGMAVRSAYALGLHREETLSIFSPEEQANRRNTWRSLFILDRFISCHLGRPTAISEDECSGDTLSPSNAPLETNGSMSYGSDDYDTTADAAQEAAVRSCSVIGLILKRVYQHRKISTSLATEMAEICREWPNALCPNLQWRHAPHASPVTGMAILHVNVLYCHSIILLTRPFFLFILNRETQKAAGTPDSDPNAPRKYSKMEKFSESCVIASTHTIVLIQNAFEARYLPQRDPFVVYFLLAASLILLSNEFAGLYVHKAADQCIQHAINIMTYCGETDPHANRLIFILTSFRDLVTQQRERRAKKAALLKPAAAAAPAVKSPPLNHFHKPDQQQQQQHQNTQLPSPATIQPLTLAPNSHTPPAPIWPSPFKFATDPAPTTLPTTSSPSPFSPPLAYPASLTPTSIDAAHNSLSSFLDISALDQASMNFPYGPATSDDGSLGDENYNIDFDTLWTWAGAVPGSASLVGDVKGISDSSVPLFGIVD